MNNFDLELSIKFNNCKTKIQQKMIAKSILKAQIPHGMMKVVAENAGVSQAAVTKYFSVSSRTSPKIYKAALKVAIDFKNQTNELEKNFLESQTA